MTDFSTRFFIFKWNAARAVLLIKTEDMQNNFAKVNLWFKLNDWPFFIGKKKTYRMSKEYRIEKKIFFWKVSKYFWLL